MARAGRIRLACGTCAAVTGAVLGTGAGPAFAQLSEPGIGPLECYAVVDDWLPGDCDQDGDVDDDDLDLLVAGFAGGPYGFGDVLTPRQGDVDWDGNLDSDDINIVSTHYGQSLPAIPLIDGVNLDTTLASKQLKIYDNDTGQYIKRETSLYDPDRTGWHPPVTDAMTQADTNSDGKIDAVPLSDMDFQIINETLDGFDLKVTYHNSDTKTRSMGCISLTGFNFGHEGTALDPIPQTGTKRNMYRGGTETAAGYDSTEFNYPGSIYSPCSVFTVDDYTVGISIQYPILEYKHNVTLVTWTTSSNPSSVSATWRVLIQPNQGDVSGYNPDANLAPDESREYVVSLRVHEPSNTCDSVNDWMRTIRPYRRYYRSLYGPVRYAADRNPAPILGFALAQDEHGDFLCGGTQQDWDAASNPYGFDNGFRPDLDGFEPFVDFLEDEVLKGWGRNMLWSTSGAYCKGSNVNNPPQFTSEWASFVNCVDPGAPGYESYLHDYSNGTTQTLGLYWGHANHYAEYWNDPTLETLDPFDPVHVAFAENEMDGAMAVNVDEVGLDAFENLDKWVSYWWLQYLQEQYPGVKFITESQHCDFMHALAPTYALVTFTPDNMGDPYNRFRDGAPIMDFMNPGHEFWGQVHPHALRKHLTGDTNPYPFDPDAAGVADELQEFADLGIVVIYHADTPTLTTGECEAAESWLTTVPEDLR